MQLLLVLGMLFCLRKIYFYFFIYLFKYSLHVLKKNGMSHKISKTKVWPGIDRCFITPTAMRNFMKINYKV